MVNQHNPHHHTFTQEDAVLFQIRLTRQLFGKQAKNARDAYDQVNLLLESDFLVTPERFRDNEAIILTSDLRRGVNVFLVVYNPASLEPCTVVCLRDDEVLSGNVVKFDDKEICEFKRQLQVLQALETAGVYCVTKAQDWFTEELVQPEQEVTESEPVPASHNEVIQREGVFRIGSRTPEMVDIFPIYVEPQKNEQPDMGMFEKLGIEPATDSIAQGVR